ncbi:MAG: peptidoglycan-binding domain-containing protein [Pseudanabaenaceae cyanobacterium bins.39]|nr:peptidoglycan-binding domain-containing protein [Pseudanabaenaceae cyanobacterium bins.39]
MATGAAFAPSELSQAQTYLQQLGLYDGDIDGIYGKLSEAAFVQFADALNIDTILDARSRSATNNLLQMPAVVRHLLQVQDNSDRLLQKFTNSQRIFVNMGQADANHLGFLDRGLHGSTAGSVKELPNRNFAASPLLGHVPSYANRLAQLPDGVNVQTYGEVAMLAGTQIRVRFRPYPKLGEVPFIENIGLEFLDSSIQEACICIGTVVNGQIFSRWLGRNPLRNVQFWSSTKIIPLLHTISAANRINPQQPIANCYIADPLKKKPAHTFLELAQRICGYYETADLTSNGLAAMFKQFTTPENLQTWLKQITGNQNLTFLGRYGIDPYIRQPFLHDPSGQELVAGTDKLHEGDNLISAYDLTRIVTQLAWHRHLPPTVRIPAAQWHSLSALIDAMAHDTARYVDVAIASLGLTYMISEPVVISKMGFGYSNLRQRTELTYTAHVQFIDHLAANQNMPTSKFRSIGITLRSALDLKDIKQEALEIDARMAATVTEILRRIITEELI